MSCPKILICLQDITYAKKFIFVGASVFVGAASVWTWNKRFLLFFSTKTPTQLYYWGSGLLIGYLLENLFFLDKGLIRYLIFWETWHFQGFTNAMYHGIAWCNGSDLYTPGQTPFIRLLKNTMGHSGKKKERRPCTYQGKSSAVQRVLQPCRKRRPS